jgi:hypothetical protein
MSIFVLGTNTLKRREGESFYICPPPPKKKNWPLETSQ